MRLIDADVMHREIDKFDLEGRMSLKNIKRYINAQPTAYDIYKIVEQLEELIEKNVGYMRATPESFVYIKAIKDAIKVVKGGAE